MSESDNTNSEVNDKEKKNDDEDKIWKDLDHREQENIDKIVSHIKENDCKIINSYNDLLYKWYFLLNAGGLIGTLTLLTLNSELNHITVLCIVLITFFLLGIMSIITATKLEINRFDEDTNDIKREFEQFKKNKMKQSYFLEKIRGENHSTDLARHFECFSLAFFIFGIVIGIGYFIIISQGYCVKCNTKTQQRVTQVDGMIHRSYK